MVRLRHHGRGCRFQGQGHSRCGLPFRRGYTVSIRARVLWSATAVAVIIVALAATVGVSRHTISNRRAACIGDLYQLGLLLRIYAGDHGGSFPSKWASIAGSMDETDLRLFLAPWDHSSPGEKTAVDSWAHYELIPGRSASDPSDAMLALGPCKKDGGYVLFVDGRVEWQDPSRFRSARSVVRVPRGQGSIAPSGAQGQR